MDPTSLVVLLAGGALGLALAALGSRSRAREVVASRALSDIARSLEEGKPELEAAASDELWHGAAGAEGRFLGGARGRFRGRSAVVSCRENDGRLAVMVGLRIENGPAVRVRRAGLTDFLDQKLRGAKPDELEAFRFRGDAAAVKRLHALARERLERALGLLLQDLGFHEVIARGGMIRASRHGSFTAADVGIALEALAELASAYERRPIVMRALGGPTLAWTGGEGGHARCPYCHGELAGDEGDLAACASCDTVHHQGCFTEHGRCSIFGCDGQGTRAREGERPGGRT